MPKPTYVSAMPYTGATDRALIARRTSRGVYGRPSAVAKLRDVEDDRVGGLGRHARDQFRQWQTDKEFGGSSSVLLESTCRTCCSALLVQSDAPDTTTMRRASGCKRRARSMVPPKSSDVTTAVASAGSPADSKTSPGQPENTSRAPGQSCAPYRLKKSSARLTDRDDHVYRAGPCTSWREVRPTRAHIASIWKRCASSGSEKKTMRRAASWARLARMALSISR